MSKMSGRELAQGIRLASAALWPHAGAQSRGKWFRYTNAEGHDNGSPAAGLPFGISQVCISYLLGLAVDDDTMLGADFHRAGYAVLRAADIPLMREGGVVGLREALIGLNEGPGTMRSFNELKKLLNTAADNLEKEEELV